MYSILASSMFFMALFGHISAQTFCNFDQIIQPGWSYSLQNIGYPQKYAAGSTCRWVARAGWNQQVQLTCDPFNLPSNYACEYDRLEIQDGNGSVKRFCGGRSFKYTTRSSRLTVKLVASSDSPGGWFRCTVEAVESPVCSCGNRNTPKIHGGEETGVHEYPFMAALIDTATRKLICGATIINEKQAMTAAHCVANRARNTLAVLVGAHDLNKVEDTPDARLLLIESYLPHPDYNMSTSVNDIALITVVGKFLFNEFISPICLPFQRARDSFSGFYTDILGWGADNIVGGPLNILMKAKVGVTSPNTCKSKYPTSTERNICTQEPNKDSCGFDSGGPLTIQSDTSRRVVQIGIINKGPSCGTGETALNLRVGPLLDWIVDNSPPDTRYCKSE